MSLPKILASHVIRSSVPGNKHGGLFLVDLESEKFECVLDWGDSINWEGRGSERGIRGIAVNNKNIFVATSNSILMLNKNFEVINRFSHFYLKFCHEIYLYENILYITSTGFDSIILFDIVLQKFIRGFCLRNSKILEFNIDDYNIIKSADSMHINNVYCQGKKIFVSGTNFPFLLCIKNNNISYILSEKGTHNCRPFDKNKIIYNNTKQDCIVIKNIITNNYEKVFKIKKIDFSGNDKFIKENVAKQPFARGLAFYKNILIGGSSPGMVSVYDLESSSKIKDIIMSNDIRLSIHGLILYNG